MSHGELRIEPSAEILAATRRWLEAVRPALNADFLASYLTGSVLTQGFDAKRSRINVVIVARHLEPPTMDRIRKAIPATKKPPHFDPLFLTRSQIEHSLDVFPIEWLDIKERHLRIEGEDVFESLEVPRNHLRRQCEHELRGKFIQMRQAYLLSGHRPAELAKVLRENASSFATLFRTLIRLQGESPPADSGQVVGSVAQMYELDAQGLLGPHLVRYSGRRYTSEEVIVVYRKFLVEFARMVTAIDRMHVT